MLLNASPAYTVKGRINEVRRDNVACQVDRGSSDALISGGSSYQIIKDPPKPLVTIKNI